MKIMVFRLLYPLVQMVIVSILLTINVRAATITCKSTVEIYTALNNVQAGDEIVIKPGTYEADGLAISGSGAHFASYADGEASLPIIMRSEDPQNPAILVGEDVGSLSCVRIFGNYWTIEGLVVTNAQKGIVFDNASFGKVINCTVYGIGHEAIHWRDGSDFGLIDGAVIRDTGLRNKGFGEAIYIGTDKGSWDTYDRDVTHVTIRNCQIGPGISAEAFDIKEGTEEIIVEYNVMDGRGLANENFGDSFIDLKGTRAYVRYNTFYQNGEPDLERAIAVIDRGVELSSYEHVIHDNTFVLDENIPIVEAYSGTSDVYAWNNLRRPSTGEYYDSIVQTQCCPEWYSPISDEPCYAPRQLQVTDVGTVSANIRWQGSSSSRSFVLFWQAFGGSAWQELSIATQNVLLSGLSDDTYITVQVRAICADEEESDLSMPAMFQTLGSSDPEDDETPPAEDEDEEAPPEEDEEASPEEDEEAPPPRPSGVVSIYEDYLASNWNDNSFTGSYNLESVDATRTGTYGIEASFGSYGGLQFKHEGFLSSVFEYVFFWIRDDRVHGVESPDLRLQVNDFTYDFKVSGPGWNYVLISIEENEISKIKIQNRSPQSRSVYIDEIELWPALGGNTPTVAPPDSPPTPEDDVTHPSPATPAPQTQPPDFENPLPTPEVPVSNPTSVLIVYDEVALQDGWYDYSFKGGFDFASQEDAYAGATSIRADFNAWGAVHIKHSDGLDSATFSEFSFKIKTLQDDHKLRIKVNGKQYDYVISTSNTWISVDVPLSVFSNPETIWDLRIQSVSSAPHVSYIDMIELYSS